MNRRKGKHILSKHLLSKAILSTAIITGSVVAPIAINDNTMHAAENHKDTYGELKQINESEANINLDKGYKTNVQDNGNATITKQSTGETKALPVTAKDKNGKKVILSYAKTNNGLKMMVIDEDKSTGERGWKKGLKCGLGTAGGMGTVGLTGFGVAGPGGAVVGAVSGGMTGAAASCF